MRCSCVGCGRDFDVEPEGGHRLMCGDSTSEDDVAKLAAGMSAALCFTSPPYGQQRDYKSGGISDWDALMRGVFIYLPVDDDAQVLVNLGLIHRDGEWLPYWDGWIEWMRAEGWSRFGWYVWDQGPGLPGDWNGRLAPAHEWIFHFNQVPGRVRKTHASKMAGMKVSGNGLRGKDGTITGKTNAGATYQATKVPDSVIRILRHKGGIGEAGKHPAIFPVALATEVMTAVSDPGDIVYEPFSGSGTQIISAETNGRRCLAMEIAPEYVDVAVRRWQLFTGKTAIREADGVPFP